VGAPDRSTTAPATTPLGRGEGRPPLELDDPEVDHPGEDVAARVALERHVGGFDVAVDHARVVDTRERGGDLHADLADHGGGHRAATPQVAEVHAVDVLGDEEAWAGLGIVAGDVLVLEPPSRSPRRRRGPASASRPPSQAVPPAPHRRPLAQRLGPKISRSVLPDSVTSKHIAVSPGSSVRGHALSSAGGRTNARNFMVLCMRRP